MLFFEPAWDCFFSSNDTFYYDMLFLYATYTYYTCVSVTHPIYAYRNSQCSYNNFHSLYKTVKSAEDVIRIFVTIFWFNKHINHEKKVAG
jgi:hypothetical protein